MTSLLHVIAIVAILSVLGVLSFAGLHLLFRDLVRDPLGFFASLVLNDRGTLTSVIGTSVKTPGAYVRVSLGVGGASAAAAAKRILVLGDPGTGGTIANNTPTLITSETDLRTLVQVGSELYRACVKALNANPLSKVYACAMARSAGSAGTTTLVFTGTASASGVFYVKAHGEEIAIAVTSGDAATTIGAAVAAAINAKTTWGFTAANVTGTVTLTAKSPRADQIRVKSRGAVAGVTHSVVDAVLGAGTITSTIADALSAVFPQRFHYIVSGFTDSVNLNLIKAHVLAQAEPLEGKRARYFFATRDTLANAIVLADTQNEARAQCLWHFRSWETCAEVSAGSAARFDLAYDGDRAANTDGMLVPGLLPQDDVADQPTRSEIESALNNGITPLEVRDGLIYVTRSVTTKSDDATNFAVIDTHYVEVADFIADDLVTLFSAVFAGAKLGVDVPGEFPEPGVATPLTIRDWIESRLRFYGEGGGGPQYLVNVEALLPRLVVEANELAPGRVDASIDLDVIELLHQFAANVRHVG